MILGSKSPSSPVNKQQKLYSVAQNIIFGLNSVSDNKTDHS